LFVSTARLKAGKSVRTISAAAFAFEFEKFNLQGISGGIDEI
jgi:hypothetical protein